MRYIMEQYYEVTSELDAREILRYLNELGIHNISGEVLKYFITDLKKLIKYDLLHKKENINTEHTGPERLHSATTFCSRVRSKTQTEVLNCSRECRGAKRPFSVRNSQSAPMLRTHKFSEESNVPLRRACSCVRDERKSEPSSKETKVTPSSNNLIKVPKPTVPKRCDPVSLYHYYSALWAKYKSNVPGENDWADLRWNVRQKMAGVIPPKDNNQLRNKVTENPAKKDGGQLRK